MWNFCFFTAIAVMLAAVVGAILTGRKYRSGRLLTPFNILFAGVLISAVLLFIPIYVSTTENTKTGFLEALFLSVYDMICIFVVNSDFDFLAQSVATLSPALYSGYSVFLSILFVVAPVLTFGFVLSFFKNVTAYQKFLFNFRTEAYVFSELNEKTLALAESIARQPGKRMFVFSDVFEKEEERRTLPGYENIVADAYRKRNSSSMSSVTAIDTNSSNDLDIPAFLRKNKGLGGK